MRRRHTANPIACTREQKLGTGARGQLAATGDDIGGDVRLCDRRDRDAFLASGARILPDVAVVVDDERLACWLAADEIAGLREVCIVESA
jgi:hypothetical protein